MTDFSKVLFEMVTRKESYISWYKRLVFLQAFFIESLKLDKVGLPLFNYRV